MPVKNHANRGKLDNRPIIDKKNIDFMSLIQNNVI